MTDVPLAPSRGFSGLQVTVFVGLAIVLSVCVTVWFIRTYLYAADFKPVALTAGEQLELDHKLRQVGVDPQSLLPDAARARDQFDANGRLVPERYVEDAAAREVRLNERELNALVASNADLARRFAIDLSDDRASAKMLIPVDPDFPFFGGKTLRVSAGLELRYQDQQPVVILDGVSVMGVPIPNAWLGNLKHVDLVKQFGSAPGGWQRFAAGVEHIEIKDGALHVTLRE